MEVFAGGVNPPREALGPMASEGPMFHMAIRTSDCDAATARARAAGFVVTVEPCKSSALRRALAKVNEMDCMISPPLDLQMLE